jgi:hypothetical protein
MRAAQGMIKTSAPVTIEADLRQYTIDVAAWWHNVVI